jgi:hypothetical protein
MRTALVLACLLLTAAVAAPMATAEAGPEPNCYEIYNEYHVGPLTVIQRSSCQYEAYVFGEPLIGP